MVKRNCANRHSQHKVVSVPHATTILIAIGLVGLLLGREWYNSLAGLILTVLGLWIGGNFPR